MTRSERCGSPVIGFLACNLLVSERGVSDETFGSSHVTVPVQVDIRGATKKIVIKAERF